MLLNQIRGLLLERGITIRKGRRHAEAALPTLLEDAENNLSRTMRQLLAQLARDLERLQSQIVEIDARIVRGAEEQEACQRPERLEALSLPYVEARLPHQKSYVTVSSSKKWKIKCVNLIQNNSSEYSRRTYGSRRDCLSLLRTVSWPLKTAAC